MNYLLLQFNMKKCFVLFLLLSVMSLESCRVRQNYTYFKDVPDSAYEKMPPIAAKKFIEPTINSNDVLQISILTLDPKENTVLALGNSSTFSVQGKSGESNTGEGVQGFLVDKDGMIELPVIGKVNVRGLTTSEARDSIQNRVALYYKTPVVNVRFLNFNITVLGEVTHPGTYTVPNEKVGVLDAIGMAGDLTIFGKRDNILLVRDSAGAKLFSRFNLGSTRLLQSPYYYLKQGDVIYVEPNRAKIASSDAVKARNYALAASIITVLVIIISKI